MSIDVPVLDYATPRHQLASAIVAYMRGDIDNFAFDDAVWDAAHADRSLLGLCFALWNLYDDVRRHPVRANRAGWQFLRRSAALLMSNEPVPPKFNRSTDQWTLWPFRSWSSVRAAAPTLATIELPRFDPAAHSRPIPPWTVTLGNGWYWIAGALIALAAILGRSFW